MDHPSKEGNWQPTFSSHLLHIKVEKRFVDEGLRCLAGNPLPAFEAKIVGGQRTKDENAFNLHSPKTNYFQSRFRNMFSLKFLVSSYEKLPGKKSLTQLQSNF